MGMIPIDIAIGIGITDEERSDYEPVPATDGRFAYRDRGRLGGYSPSETPFMPPDEVQFETGFGAEMADLKRGYCEPLITDNPAYQFDNYHYRASKPSRSDVDKGDVDAMPSDIEFRNRNRTSQGFLTRPRVPTERN